MAEQERNRIETISLDEATVLARSEDVEKEREVALRDLVEDNLFRPLRAIDEGHEGPWQVHLAVIDGMLAWHLTASSGEKAGTIGLWPRADEAQRARLFCDLRFVLQRLAPQFRAGNRNDRYGTARNS